MKMNMDMGMKMPESQSAPEPAKASEPIYPSLYIDSDVALSDIPESGTMTVEYKVRSRSQNKSADGERHSLSLDVTKILEVEGGDEGEASINDEDADREAGLDKLAAEEAAKSKETPDEE